MSAWSADPGTTAGVRQAERGVGQRVQPLRLDRLAADLAAAIAAVVDAPERALDLLDQVPEVADQRQVPLALRGERAGVRGLLAVAAGAAHFGAGRAGRLQAGVTAGEHRQLVLEPP